MKIVHSLHVQCYSGHFIFLILTISIGAMANFVTVLTSSASITEYSYFWLVAQHLKMPILSFRDDLCRYSISYHEFYTSKCLHSID